MGFVYRFVSHPVLTEFSTVNLRAIIRDRGYVKNIFSDFEAMSDDHFTELTFIYFHNRIVNSLVFQKNTFMNTFSTFLGLVQAIEKT